MIYRDTSSPQLLLEMKGWSCRRSVCQRRSPTRYRLERTFSPTSVKDEEKLYLKAWQLQKISPITDNSHHTLLVYRFLAVIQYEFPAFQSVLIDFIEVWPIG